MVGEGKAREDDPAARIAHKTFHFVYSVFSGILDGNGSIAVGYTGGRPEEDRRLIFLRQFEGFLDHAVGFSGGRGIQQRHLGEGGKRTGILLRLGGDGTGIVGHQHDQAAFYADIFQAHQGIGGDVQAHLFHGNQRAGTRVRGPASQFHGDLFIHGPFHICPVPAALCHGFEHFGGRRSRIAADDVHAGSQRTEGNRLISHQKFIMHNGHILTGILNETIS